MLFRELEEEGKHMGKSKGASRAREIRKWLGVISQLIRAIAEFRNN